MPFISKHTSCILFITATLFVTLTMVVDQVSSAPAYTGCSGSSVPSDPNTQEHIEQVLGGVEILIELGSHLNGTILNISDFQHVRIINSYCINF